ncbi:TRAP transporter large permease subunit [Castellaniella sp.]|uniref:TRAP transporter large permease n=1 Tax=Castellaniella sp. TaxID=1955812 RepID=UPI00355E4FC9
MDALLIAYMAPIMFGTLVVLLLLGFPVAFSLAANGILFGLIGVDLGLLSPALFQALPQRVFGVMSNEALLAIPFFTFMGLILERSGMAEDLLETIGQLFGPMRGGLAIAVVIVGAMLAATTGVVSASVISMGLISLPIMLRYGYDRRLATGVIAASGTLSQIIPPSLVLIVLADQLGRSIGDMYKGAFLPGFALTGLYIVYVLTVAFFRPRAAPAIPIEARTFIEPNGSHGIPSLLVLMALSVGVSLLGVEFLLEDGGHVDELIVTSILIWGVAAFIMATLNKVLRLGLLSQIAERVTFVMIPPLALIFLVLGTIFIGVATPTEGGAMGAVGALVMALIKRRLNLQLLRQAMDTTTTLTCFVVFILIGSSVFSLTFRGVDGDLWVEHLLTSLAGGDMGFLIVVSILTFCLAFFLDFFELAFIIVPLIGPVADKMGIDLIWLGILLAVNMQTSFMHPPFGFALFYLRSVAPKDDYTDKLTGQKIARVTTGQIYWGSVPFILIQIVMVVIVLLYPQMVTHYKADRPDVNLDEISIDIGDDGNYGGGGYGDAFGAYGSGYEDADGTDASGTTPSGAAEGDSGAAGGPAGSGDSGANGAPATTSGTAGEARKNASDDDQYTNMFR